MLSSLSLDARCSLQSKSVEAGFDEVPAFGFTGDLGCKGSTSLKTSFSLSRFLLTSSIRSTAELQSATRTFPKRKTHLVGRSKSPEDPKEILRLHRTSHLFTLAIIILDIPQLLFSIQDPIPHIP